jgi:hypothetical protein
MAAPGATRKCSPLQLMAAYGSKADSGGRAHRGNYRRRRAGTYQATRSPATSATNGPIFRCRCPPRRAIAGQHGTPTLQEPSPHRANGIDEQSAIQKQISRLAACLRDQEAAMTCGAVKCSVIIR